MKKETIKIMHLLKKGAIELLEEDASDLKHFINSKDWDKAEVLTNNIHNQLIRIKLFSTILEDSEEGGLNYEKKKE